MGADETEPRLFLGRAQVPMSQLPEGGVLPERGTPDAVVYLRRLALLDPEHDGYLFRSALRDVADGMNNALPVDQRVANDDERTASGFPRISARGAVEAAVVALNAYTEDPNRQRIIQGRLEAFHSLERYFSWCRTMRNAAVDLDAAARGQRAEYDADEPPLSLDDLSEAQVGRLLHWLASLQPVIEGWIELNLSDPEIDAVLAAGGDDADESSPRHRLWRLRNGVFHYQRKITPPHMAEFFGQPEDEGAWAVRLERAFEAFFRRSRESRLENVDVWLNR